MAEGMLLTPPAEVVQAIALPRKVCHILVVTGGLYDNAWCNDQSTLIGCRTATGEGGCLLRNTGFYRDGSTKGFRIDNLYAAGYKLE